MFLRDATPIKEQAGKETEKGSNLSFTAPTPKSLPEAVLNDGGKSLHAEVLRRKEVRAETQKKRESK